MSRIIGGAGKGRRLKTAAGDATRPTGARVRQSLFGGEIQVFRQETRTALAAFADRGLRFDVVYLDPPYASELYEPLLEAIGARLLAEGGVAVAEHFHKRPLPERIGALARSRLVRIGDHCLSFYRRGEAGGDGAAGVGGDEAH